MFDRLLVQPMLRWLRRYDREYHRSLVDNNRLNRRLVGAEKENAALGQTLAQTRQDLTAVSSRTEDLQRQLTEATAHCRLLESERAEASEHRRRLDRELTTAAARQTTLEQELAAAAGCRSELQQRVSSLEDEIRREPWAQRVLDDDFIANRVSPSRQHAWLVAAPKSGSTWLTNMLVELLGWQPHMLVAVWDRREQEVDLRRMLEFPEADLFSIQQHCRFSGPTRDFVRKFRVRVVLQGRNLWDCIVSLRDHFLRESVATPVCYVDDSFRGLAPERQLDWVIDLAAPWYFNFYASWYAGRSAGEVDFLWIDYESLCRDVPGQLRRIADYLGVDRSDAEIESAIARSAGKPTRFNVGRTGRGQESLTADQKARIARLRSYYPHIDFSPIGLD
jgi:hypothetical protein